MSTGLKRYVLCAGVLCFSSISGALSADVCGVNLFNPVLLTEADFQESSGSYIGTWQYLNNYVSNYSFDFIPGKVYTVRYEIECPAEHIEVGNTHFAFKLSDGSIVGPASNYCTGQGGHVVTVRYDTPVDRTVVGMVVQNVSGTELSRTSFRIQNVMVAESSQTTYVAYNPCIKLATKASVETRAVAVENRLSDVRNVINDLVTRMQTNSAGIGTLQSGKQTRPASTCPADKKCLLVKDIAGQNNWYEITDCNENAFLSNVGVQSAHGIGPGEPYGMGTSSGDQLMCRTQNVSMNIGCAANEWVRGYANGLVYGVSRRVAIGNMTAGSVVQLPNGVATGDVCVCRATRYRLWDSGTSSLGDSVSIDTGDWQVAGVAYTDERCLLDCGELNYYQYNDVVNYYASISNDCFAGSSDATMCYTYPFLGDVSNLFPDGNSSVEHGVTGGVRVDGTQWGAGCGNDNTLTDTGHCGTGTDNRGTWVTRYYTGNSSGSDTELGYIYGYGRYANVPAGTAVGSVIDVSLNAMSTTFSNQNAIVCVVKGFKRASATSETVLATASNSAKVFVATMSPTDGALNSISADGCGEYSMAAFKNLYAQLGSMCVAY